VCLLLALQDCSPQAEGEGAILYLEELHSLVGPPLAAAPLLKAALKTSPKLRCIGASTLEQYRLLVETDAALERRFQQVLLGAEQLPVEVDLPAVREAAEREVAELAAERRLLSGEQLGSLRRRADISAELEEIATQREETTAAQAAAAAAEDYARAASLSEHLETLVAREGSLRGEEAREEGRYDRAAARRGELVRREEAAWAALAEQCRACLAARRALASEAVEEEEEALRKEEARRSTLSAETTAEEEAMSAAIADETRHDVADRAQWETRERGLAAEVAALREALDQKLAEQAKCGVNVARCDAAIEEAEARLATSAGAAELRSKLDALEQAEALSVAIAATLQESKARHEATGSAFAAKQKERAAWVGAAAAAVHEAESEVERQQGAQRGAARLVSAASSLALHRSQEREQCGRLLDALADCRAAQRRHSDAIVQGEAEAGRLQLEVKGLQDQRARLELEVKLASSSRKFAEAAELSAELKALCVKLDGDEDVALQQQVLEQVETEKASLAAESAREEALQRELQQEQRSLDRRRFDLLLEHLEAVRAVLPEAEAAQAELLSAELEQSDAARHELMRRWAWDNEGRPTAKAAAATQKESKKARERASDEDSDASSRPAG